MSEVNQERRVRLLQNRLDNNGFFIHEIEDELIVKDKKGSIKYHLSVDEAYRVNIFFWFDEGQGGIKAKIAELQESSLIAEGKRYDLNLIRRERNRIEAELRDIGYYYFSADDLIFRADSSVGNRNINIAIDIKENVRERNLRRYTINNTFIRIASTTEIDTQRVEQWDTLENNVFYRDVDRLLNPNLLNEILILRNGDVYNRTAQTATYRQLMDLGVFQFVQIQFRESEPGTLDMYINASNLPKRSLSAELLAVSKSNNFAGPVLNTGLINRNLFRGAEHFFLDAKFGFETQISSEYRGMHAYDLSLETGIKLPRLFPFRQRINNSNAWNLPKTTISVGYQLLNRVQFFRMQSYNFKFAYFIPQNRYIWHEVSPLQIKYISMGNISGDFKQALDENPFLQRSFEEQLIAGLSYGFFLNTQRLENRTLNHYFNLNFESAGNSLSGITSFKDESMGERTILGNTYSQFVKADFDYRMYWQPNERREGKLVFRLFTGAGLPYGNSESLPYVYQYFSGGSNSIRAFRARSIGPGSYKGSDNISFFDRTGDIKLEANIEYRFPMSNIFKGALFFDAGNIWQWENEETEPEKNFSTDRFYKELALGTGIGLRLDVSFFVLRLDLAFPVHNPLLDKGERWVINTFNPLKRDWRRENLVLNLAIGYPF